MAQEWPQYSIVDDSMDRQLAEKFTNLVVRLGASQELSHSWTSEFLARYTEPQRHYHTLFHVDAMFGCLEVRQAAINDIDALSLAIFFHDWIYDPTKVDNEIQSMQKFTHFANDVNLVPNLRDKVNSYIECTIRHTQPKQEHIISEDPDLSLFLDADLEVLSRTADEYQSYAQQIRKEYAHYENNEYCQGRARVLRAFLSRDKIYFSRLFASSEDVARRNMEAEIARLETEVGMIS